MSLQTKTDLFTMKQVCLHFIDYQIEYLLMHITAAASLLHTHNRSQRMIALVNPLLALLIVVTVWIAVIRQ